MGLIQVSSTTVTSAVSSVAITGIDTSDQYQILINGWTCATDNTPPLGRVTTSGTAQTANYAGASKNLMTTTSFVNGYYRTALGSGNYFYFSEEIGTGTGEACNMLINLYNFNNTDEYSYISYEPVAWTASPRGVGRMGGGVYSVAEANDGMSFSMGTGNITGGTFTLYRLV